MTLTCRKRCIIWTNKSVAFDYLDNFENMKLVLDLFKNNPLYYSMLVLDNKERKSPLYLAIENKSVKTIELILNYIIQLEHFSLSRKIFKNFSSLFKMNLKSFEKYLNS